MADEEVLQAELIARWPADQEAEVRAFVVTEGRSVIELSANRWWADSTDMCRLRVTIEGAVDARLTTGERGVPSISDVHPMLLEYGDWKSIFGQAPLPDPYRFFLEFHRHVRDRLGLLREPVEYLNFNGSMIHWLELVYSRAYLLLTAPTAVVEGAIDMLEAQSVPHIALPQPSGRASAVTPRLIFRCGNSWVAGEEAHVAPLDESL